MSDLNVANASGSARKVTLHVSYVQRLINTGIEIHEYQERISALKLIAATRPLTKEEVMQMEDAEFNLEHNLEVLRNNAGHFAQMERAA